MLLLLLLLMLLLLLLLYSMLILRRWCLWSLPLTIHGRQANLARLIGHLTQLTHRFSTTRNSLSVHNIHLADRRAGLSLAFGNELRLSSSLHRSSVVSLWLSTNCGCAQVRTGRGGRRRVADGLLHGRHSRALHESHTSL